MQVNESQPAKGRMTRFLFRLVTLVLLTAPPAAAKCAGQNLFDQMDPTRRAAIEAATEAVPFPKGNFWRATRGDQVITIAGTYHFDDPRHAANLAALTPAITSATTVLVEAGPDEEKAMKSLVARDPSKLVITEGPTLAQDLPPEVWNPLKAAMSDRGIPAFMAAKFRPWYVLTLLSIPPCAMAQMTEQPKGLDGAVIDTALAANVPVKGLEPFDTLFTIFEGMTKDEITEMLVSTLAIDAMSEDYFTTLVDSYFAGESRAAWELMRYVSYDLPGYTHQEIDADFARMEELVAFSRNRSWIPVLTKAAAEGPVFAAFGALHLPGTDGVLNLLQSEGFTIEPLDL
jgi:uncharacterized protein YbaP (TraB family)